MKKKQNKKTNKGAKTDLAKTCDDSVKIKPTHIVNIDWFTVLSASQEHSQKNRQKVRS